MAEVQLRTIFRPYLRGVSCQEVENKIKLHGENVHRLLKKREASVLLLRDLLAWKRPERSAVVLVFLSAGVWLVSSLNANIALVAATVLICVSITEACTRCNKSTLPAAEAARPAQTDPLAGTYSPSAVPREDAALALQDLSYQVATLWVYLGLYAQAAGNMRTLHPGAFCVVVSSFCLVLACVGRLLSGTVTIYISLLTIMTWPCIQKYDLASPLRRCLQPAGVSSPSPQPSVTAHKDAFSGSFDRIKPEHHLASDDEPKTAAEDSFSVVNTVHPVSSVIASSASLACPIPAGRLEHTDGQSFLPDICEMPSHDVDESAGAGESSHAGADLDELSLPPDFLASHFSGSIEINDTDNAFHLTSSERERFTHAELDPESVDVVTSALETAIASAASSIVTASTCEHLVAEPESLLSAEMTASGTGNDGRQHGQQSAKVEVPGQDSDSDFEVLSVDDFDAQGDVSAD